MRLLSETRDWNGAEKADSYSCTNCTDCTGLKNAHNQTGVIGIDDRSLKQMAVICSVLCA